MGVVVGTDGSPNATKALDWAACEAFARGVPLRVVVVPATPDAEDASSGADVLHKATIRCGEQVPGQPVTGVVRTGSVASVLLEQAAEAELLVVGHQGRGGRLGAHVGSVPGALVRHASCPVVVVRDGPLGHPPSWRGDVLAGVDGSYLDDLVLAAAFAAAADRTGRLTVAHAWDVRPGPDQPPTGSGRREQEAQRAAVARAHELVDAAIARWSRHYPEVTVVGRAVRGGPIETLVQLSADYALLVLGAVGEDAEPALLLGSVPRALAHSASCPVQVVRVPS